MTYVDPCESELELWYGKWGMSRCDLAIKKRNRRRVDRENPKLRRKRSWAEHVRLYKKQRGICGICGSEMVLIRGEVEIDHKNPSLPPDEFEHERNLQLAHIYCNRHKGAMSLADQAKHYGKTVAEIIGNEGETD
jgi:5-methylcytosine-specific restriction endonuclease McrA